MTNYRIEMCEHISSMFNYCFTCGSKLKIIRLNNERIKICSSNSIHLKIFFKEKDKNYDDENVHDCEDIKFI